MDSPGRWESGVLEQDVLPCTSSFVQPGQEDFFLLQAQCFNSEPRHFRSGSVPASPIQPGSAQTGLLLPGSGCSGGPGSHLHGTVEASPQPANSSPGARVQLYQMPPMHYQASTGASHLAALDLAAVSHSPGRGPPQGSPSRLFSSPTALRHGLEPGLAMYGTNLSYTDYNAAECGDQYGSQPAPQQQQQQSPAHLPDQRLLVAATGRAAAVPGDASGNPVSMAVVQGSRPRYHQEQQQHPISPQSQANGQALALRPGVAEAYGLPLPPPLPPPQQQQQQQLVLYHSSPPKADGGGGGNSNAGVQEGLFLRPPEPAVGCPAAASDTRVAAHIAHGVSRAAPGREGVPGPGSGPTWFAAPDTAGHPRALPLGGSSPPQTQPVTAAFCGGSGGGDLRVVRHIVEDLRTSPLILPSDYETPVRPSMGGGGVRSMGGAAHGGGGGGSSAERNAALQRYQAQILSLERQNAELHKRLADVQAALEASLQARQALEAKQDAMADQVAQANHSAKSRESALESARRANDALSGQLQNCQEELAAARNALAAAKDTAVQWQDRAMEVGKELEAARKKIETLGEEERRLSSENMTLRKEVQQMNDVIIKGRIETSELREKLRGAQQETARAASTAQALASRAESEQEGAAVQLALMRNKVAEVESRNSQLLYDMAALREEVARARQAADAAKAALVAKPAGLTSDGGSSARQHPHSAWTHNESNPSGGGGGGGGGYVAFSGGGYGGIGSYGGGGGGGSYGGGSGGTGYGGPSYGGSINYGTTAAAASTGGISGASGGGAFARPPLPPPATSFATPLSEPPGGTAAAVLRDLPPDVAFSKMDPETFRSMVRAEAEAMARAAAGASGGGGGGAAGPSGGGDGGATGAGGGGMHRFDAGLPPPPSSNSPMKASYGTRYGSDLAAAFEPSSATAGGGGAIPLPPRVAWGDSSGRDSLVLPPPPPSLPQNVRDSWRAPPLREERHFGAGGASVPNWQQQVKQGGSAGGVSGGAGAGLNHGVSRAGAPPNATSGGGGGSGGSPPPYAVHTVDNSYAYRRPPNAVGAGTGPSGGGGIGGGDTPYGTEETVKDMMSRSKALEDQLMALCAEKGGLEAEYARMPLGAGRSLRERNRKALVEQRLELINKEISSVRMQLKRLGVK